VRPATGGEADVAPGWPAELRSGPVGLRPIRYRDAGAWREVRDRNADWLRPWEATAPGDAAAQVPFWAWVRHLKVEAAGGRALPFVVTYEGRLAGQLTVGGLTMGSLRSAYIGYWVDRAVAGRGVIPTAVALTTDHCFRAVGLHRVEVNIRPENVASRRVVEKLGFREEGLRPRYLHIDGSWRDHLSYALTVEDVPHGLLARWDGVRRQTQ
jgi:[ribosomal protein S5]-alanine N-acetyltransferase